MGITIQIKDYNVQEMVEGVSTKLSTAVEVENNEHCVRIPKKLGSGFIKATHFDNGVGVLEFDCLLKEELVLEMEKGVVHPLKFIFNRESTISHKFEGDGEAHEISRLQNIIVSSTPENNHVLAFPANKAICVFSLEVDRKRFEGKIESYLMDMNEDIVKLFRDVNGVNLFLYKGNYSLDIAKFIKEFTECELTDFMKTVYKEGKAYEILTHQLQQYLDDLHEPGKRKILRQATIEKVEEAVKIIEEELENMDNIVSLAKRVGLNQNSLQNGFMLLYKTSVNEYIRNYRIERAKELLEDTELNVTEVCYRIGINSRSYFSKLFKKKYGLSPRAYLNQVQNKEKRSKTA
ncbi:MAG: AraC family transcriptional regulator [Sediminicola sp.]